MKPPLKYEHAFPTPALERRLREIYNRYQQLDDGIANRIARRDFVFHMTDWIEDLERLAALYDGPDKFDRAEAGDIVFRFLIHALPHLMAAGQLLLDKLCDPFSVLPKARTVPS